MAKAVRVVGRAPRSGDQAQRNGTSEPVSGSGVAEITTPTGATQVVLTESEKKWYETHRDEYLGERDWSTTDLSQLDQLLSLELILQRFSAWSSAMAKYDGTPLSVRDVSQLSIRIKDTTALANSIRDALGLSRAAKLAEAQSVQAYLFKLRTRAREFGQMRTEQEQKAIEILKELAAHVGMFDRSTDQERRVAGFPNEAALIQWFRLKMPEFDAIDADFRQRQQRWVGEL